MFYYLCEHSGTIIMITAILIFLYFLATSAIRKNKILDKREELMKRVMKVKEKMEMSRLN